MQFSPMSPTDNKDTAQHIDRQYSIVSSLFPTFLGKLNMLYRANKSTEYSGDTII